MLSDGRGAVPGASDEYRHRLAHPSYPAGYTYKTGTPPASPSRCCLRVCAPQRVCCCCYCPTKLSSTACTCFGVCVLVLGYTLLGAFTFMALEGGLVQKEVTAATSVQKTAAVLGADIRSKTVEKLWSITEDLNILYKDNWTRLAAQEVLKFQDSLVKNLRGYNGASAPVVVKNGNSGGVGGGAVYYSHHHHKWSFSSSFLYSLTLITTIGYGSVSPRTAWGKVITIVYALVGIPLMLIYLSTAGEVLARSFRRLYGRLFCASTAGDSAKTTKNSSSKAKGGHHGVDAYLSAKLHNHIGHDAKMNHADERSKMDHGSNVMILDCESLGGVSGHSSIPAKHPHDEAVRVPISLCLVIIVVYICGGAVLFNKLENWTFLEGSYFCFTSLGTIGFGDLVPGLYHSYQIQYQTGGSTYTLEQLSIFVSSAYILVGMALIAMCFNLVQEEVIRLVRRFGKYFGVAHSHGGKGDDEDDVTGDEGDGMAMAVVSSGHTS